MIPRLLCPVCGSFMDVGVVEGFWLCPRCGCLVVDDVAGRVAGQ